MAAGHTQRIFSHSVNTVMLCEANETAGAAASASAPLVTNRHLEGSNYAFADGHVKWLRSSSAATPSSVRASGSNFTFGA